MNNTEYIEKYLDGELTSEEKVQFESQLNSDSGFREEFHLQKEIRNAFVDEDIIELHSTLFEVKKEYKKRKINVWYYAAASLAGLVLLSNYIFFQHSYSDKDIFEKYYSPYNSSGITRGNVEQDKVQIFDAMLMYSNHKYLEAIPLFLKINESSNFYESSRFYLAISYIETKFYGEASSILDEMETKENSLLYEDVLWYNGLSYLANGKKDDAIMRFKELVEIKSRYAESSKQIISSISE